MTRFHSGLWGLLLSACGEPPPDVTIDAASPQQVEPVTPMVAPPLPLPPEIPQVASPTIDLPITALERLEAPIHGHVLIPRPTEWLAELRAQVVPPRLASMATPEGFLAFVALSTGIPPKLAEKTDLTRPLGCVAGELAPIPEVACVFGYRGGAGEFAADVGAGEASKEGHLAAFTLADYRVYVDAIGEDVAISVSPGVLLGAAPYIERNMIGRAPTLGVDLEAVVFADVLWQRHGEALSALAAQPDPRAQDLLSSDNALLRRLSASQIDHQSRANAASAKKLGEYTQATLFVDLDRGRLAVGVHAIPKPGGRFPAQSLSKGRSIDFEQVGALPAETLALVAFDMDPWALVAANRYTSGPLTEEDVRASIGALASMWSALSGGPFAAAEQAITAHLREEQNLYSGQATWAAMTHPDTPLALVGVYRLAPGREGRTAWKAWARRMKSGVLRGELGTALAWSFTPGARRFEETEVDRWTIWVANQQWWSEAQARLPALTARFPNGLHVDRIERDGKVHFVIAPGAEDAVLRRLFAAQDGERRLAEEPRFASLRTRDPDAHMLFAADLAGVRGTLAAEPELVAALGASNFISTDVGEGLDDMALRVGETQTGVVRGELVLGPGLLRLRGQ